MNAHDVMTRTVVTVPPKAAISDVLHLMLRQRISGLPVVDENGRIVGIITEGDLLRRAEIGTGEHRPAWLDFLRGVGHQARDYVLTHARTVDELMTQDVVTAPDTASLEQVVDLMQRHRIKRVPIVTMGRLVGVVSRADLLGALAVELDKALPAAADDTGIRKQVEAKLRGQPWCRGNRVNTVVVEGIVFLEGVVFDEREHEAIRVAVENVPGVKAVADHLAYIDPNSVQAYGIY